jgi:hypothetical protein
MGGPIRGVQSGGDLIMFACFVDVCWMGGGGSCFGEEGTLIFCKYHTTIWATIDFEKILPQSYLIP